MRDLVPGLFVHPWTGAGVRSWFAATETPDPSDITLFLRARGGETALGDTP